MKETFLNRLENSFLKYATGILILVIPLYPKFPLFLVPKTNVAIRLEDFLIATILFIGSVIIIRRKAKIWKDPIFVAVGLFFLTLLTSLLSGIFVTHTVTPYIGFFHFARRIEYMAVIFLAAISVKDPTVLKFYIKLIFVVSIIISFYGLGQKFFAFPVISTMNAEFAQGLALSLGPEARVNATFAGHYDLSAYMVTVLLVVLGSILYASKKGEKTFLFVLFTLFVWLIVASASRISLAAYLFVALLLLVVTKRYVWIIPVLVVSLTLAAFSQSLTSRYANVTNVTVTNAYLKYLAFTQKFSQETITEVVPTATPLISVTGTVSKLPKNVKATPRPRRVRPTPTLIPIPVIEDRSMAIRLNVEWPRAIRALEKNPLLGTGPSSITLATDNDYLRSLGEAGIMGTLALVNVFLIIWKTVRNTIKRPVTTIEGAFGWAMTFGTIGLLINAAFIDVFEASKVAISYWVLVGIWIGSARLGLANDKK